MTARPGTLAAFVSLTIERAEPREFSDLTGQLARRHPPAIVERAIELLDAELKRYSFDAPMRIRFAAVVYDEVLAVRFMLKTRERSSRSRLRHAAIATEQRYTEVLQQKLVDPEEVLAAGGALSAMVRFLVERGVRELWDHERREWLRCDGLLVDDPHANERRR